MDVTVDVIWYVFLYVLRLSVDSICNNDFDRRCYVDEYKWWPPNMD